MQMRPFSLAAFCCRRGYVWSGMGSCLGSPLYCCNLRIHVHLDFRFEVVVKIGEDWKYEEDCVIDDSHSLFCIAQAEAEHIKDCGDEEDDEGGYGCQQGGLGEGQWIGWFAKPSRVRIFNTEASKVDTVNIPEKRASLVWYEDNIVHQALHSHVQAVGLDQDLNEYLDQSEVL